MQPLQIGLIGCGDIGLTVHLQNLCRINSANVVAFADSDASRRRLAQDRVPQASGYNDYRELLAVPEIEAVIIALPNALHADVAIAALNHNKHVYLEKPLATTLTDGERIANAWRLSKKQAMIGFNFRFNPLHQQLKRELRADRLGRVRAVRSVFSTAARRLPAWKCARETGGGALLDLASHHVDLVHFWFNEPVIEVRATVESIKHEGDTATLELRLPNKLVIQSFFSAGSVDDDHFEIYGEGGRLSLDRYASWQVDFRNGRRPPLVSRCFKRIVSAIPRSLFAVTKLRAPACEQSFALALEHFIESVRRHEPVQPKNQAGLESLAVIAAAEESAATGRPARVRAWQHVAVN